MKRKAFLLISLLMCFILLFSACGGKPSAETPAASSETPSDNSRNAGKDTLVIASLEIPNTLDAMQPLSASYLRRLGAAEALFKVDEGGKVLPELAESAKQINDVTWEIKLRPGIKFWSGKECDADAVVASLKESQTEDTGAASYLKDLTFEKADNTTVRITTARKNMQVPLNLSVYQTLIHNAEASYDSVDNADYTGMYKIADFKAEESITLEANEKYWGDKPQIKKIVNNQIPDEQSRVLLAKSGEADIITDIPTAGVAELSGSNTVRLTEAPSANAQTIYFNLSKPQFQDVRVRQALSWGLDREELVLLGAEGQSSPITTWLGANPAYPEAKTAVYGTKADPEKAAALLDEAGWTADADGKRIKNGEQLTIRLMTWGSEKALGEAIQNEWSRLGIDVQVQHVDYSVIEDARKSGDWDAFIEAWGTFGDAYALLSGQYSASGSANYGGYKDSETIALLDKLGKAAEESSRKELALQINKRVAEQAPVICLYARPQIVAVSKSLQGFTDHFRQYEYLVNADLKFVG